MSEVVQGVGTVVSETPSPVVAETPKPAEPVQPQPETVSKADLERALKDLHKYKAQVQEFKEKSEQEKIQRMKEQNQWREIAEAKEREALEFKKQATEVQQSYLNEKKYAALSSACSQLGLRPEAVSDLELIDLSAVQIETTSTGKINVLGADKVAEQLKRQKPHWFSEPKPPLVNSSGQRVHDQSGTITYDMLMTAEKEAQKSGDMSKYAALHKQFQQQQQRLRLAR